MDEYQERQLTWIKIVLTDENLTDRQKDGKIKDIIRGIIENCEYYFIDEISLVYRMFLMRPGENLTPEERIKMAKEEFL